MTLSSSDSTVVQLSAEYLKVDGLSLASGVGTKREKMVKELMKAPWPIEIAQW
jgi:hypothetical protein